MGGMEGERLGALPYTHVAFWAWSIAQAWDWLIHLPFVGFVILLVLGLWLFGLWWRERTIHNAVHGGAPRV
jgi:hypothetical protein